ncbi:MAG: exonuclease SbcCD subunit D C-terminal domain-containing protein [Synergistaceae bacterium]|nr:exonuclease SbcCD subunit D C-terminal domain-containing protein [Synergistaceae bacterium]
MRILHTSDIHTGRKLKDRDRTDEFRKFFCWLEEQITNEEIDTLLISGDIFDNTTPSVTAQNIYYRFLGHIAESRCRHTVIISGNHDSASFIDAPSDILKLCKVHVTGQACTNPEDEVTELKDSDGRTELIVCAVPYLRDKDVRTVSADDSFSDIDHALQAGIRAHYERVFEHAKSLQGDLNVPIIAMGHLFLKNGLTREGDGVRSLYVGTSVEVSSDIFPEYVTYTALGHLHSAQYIGRENIRYSGSPIAMGFGEAGQNKSVSVIETDGKNLVSVKEIPVPVFQRLERISGDMNELENEINTLGHENESIWLDVTYTGEDIQGNLQDKLNNCVKKFPLIDILSVRDESPKDNPDGISVPDGLDSITPLDMLKFCFDENDTPKEQRDILVPLYEEILRGLEVDY